MKGRGCGDAEPVVPVEGGGHRVGAVGQRVGVAPLLLAPGMDFLDLADGAGSGSAATAVLYSRARVDLDAHLGDEVLLARRTR